MTRNDPFAVGTAAHAHIQQALQAVGHTTEDNLKRALHEFMAGLAEVRDLPAEEIEAGVIAIAREEGLIELLEDEGT